MPTGSVAPEMNDWLTLLGTTAEAGSAGSTAPNRPAIMPMSANIEIRRIRLILRVEKLAPTGALRSIHDACYTCASPETAGDLGELRADRGVVGVSLYEWLGDAAVRPRFALEVFAEVGMRDRGHRRR